MWHLAQCTCNRLLAERCPWQLCCGFHEALTKALLYLPGIFCYAILWMQANTLTLTIERSQGFNAKAYARAVATAFMAKYPGKQQQKHAPVVPDHA
jgi:hypothetical protein